MTHGVGAGKPALVAHVHRHAIAGELGKVVETEMRVLRRWSLDELHNWHRELHQGISAARDAAWPTAPDAGTASGASEGLAASRAAEFNAGGPRGIAPAGATPPAPAGANPPT